MSETEFVTISLDNLGAWIESKLKSKYEVPLEGIEKRFLPVFSGFEELLRSTLKISSILQETSEISSNKVYLDNMIHILNEVITEYPNLIDYSYIEGFICNFSERYDIFKTSFHPLIHLTLHDLSMNKQLHKNTKIINSVLAKLPGYVEDVKTRFDLSRPLLAAIDACQKMFKDPSASVLTDIKSLQEYSKIKVEYESLKIQLKRYPISANLPQVLKRMAELILEFNECQIELESTLEPIFQMCQIVKNKGKKIIREDSKEDIGDLLSYVNLLLKPDFYSLLTQVYNKDDLVYAIMHLQSHKNLYNELKKLEPYKSDLSTISFVKEEDLKVLIYKWQDFHSEIEKLRKSPEFLPFFHDFLSNISVPIDDLKLLTSRLRDFHKATLFFHSTNTRFKRLRYKVFRFCLEEFGQRVELLWPESCSKFFSQELLKTVVFGNTELLGYYYAEVWVGTPPVRQTVIIDTGSTLTAFPCSGCENCGQHLDSYFDPLRSSTFKNLKCDQGVACSACNNGLCEYHMAYAEGSSISGVLAEDYLDLFLSDELRVYGIFGCHRRETNLFKSQRVDGIMGLGQKRNQIASITDKLYENQKVHKDVFSLCLGKQDGLLQIGSYNSSLHITDVKWTNFFDDTLYSVKLQEMTVDGEGVGLDPQDFSGLYTTGTIIDSGTSFLYLTERVYLKFIKKFKEFCKSISHCKAQTVRVYGEPNRCFVFDSKFESSDFFQSFPRVKFRFGDGVEVEWNAEYYLFAWPETPNYYCIGIYNNFDGGNILGGVFMRGHDIIFDRENKRIGLADSLCETGLPKNHSRSVFPYSTDPSEYTPIPVNLVILCCLGATMLLTLCYFLNHKKVGDLEESNTAG